MMPFLFFLVCTTTFLVLSLGVYCTLMGDARFLEVAFFGVVLPLSSTSTSLKSLRCFDILFCRTVIQLS